MMQSITFECEVITPMFLAGADGSTPELRPPSIKGALRFWWRALNGHLPLDKLKAKEGEIFGDAEKGRSKVIIRIIKKDLIVKSINKNHFNTGSSYLFYSAFMNKRDYFSEGNFYIKFESLYKELLNEAIEAFKLLAILGGIGTRSRRCAGNFRLTKVDTFNTINDFESRIKGIITPNSQTSNLSEFPILSNASISLVNSPKDNSLFAIDEIGNNFQQFRLRKQPDYSEIKKYIQDGDRINNIERPAFGLPIRFRYRSLKGDSASIIGNKRNSNRNDEKFERSASSLIISIVKINNSFYPIITNFNSKLLPNGTRLKISSRSQNKSVYVNTPSPNIKEEFINSLDTIQII